MKKTISRVLTLCLALALVFSLVACGPKNNVNATPNNNGGAAVSDNGGTTPSDTAASPSDNGGTTPDNSSAAPSDNGGSNSGLTSSGKYATIDEYVKSDAVQSGIKKEIDEAAEAGMTMELYGDGDKLVYSFKYGEQFPEDSIEAVKAALEEGIEENAETFVKVTSALKLAVDVDDPKVVVMYLNADGTELYSREFSAK